MLGLRQGTRFLQMRSTKAAPAAIMQRTEILRQMSTCCDERRAQRKTARDSRPAPFFNFRYG
jgi:hypothetical protein